MGRADRKTIDKRVETARLLLIRGAAATKVVRDLSEKWSISQRQVERYVSEAQQQIRDAMDVERAYQQAEAWAARRDLRLRARAAGDLRVELDTLKDEAKLLGLYAPDQSEVRLEVDDTRAEVRSRIDSLATRLRAGSGDGGIDGDAGSRGGPGA